MNFFPKSSMALLSAMFVYPQFVTADDIVAVYDLKGPLAENGVREPGMFDVLGNGERPLTHFDIIDSLNYAVKDEDVKAIVLDIDDASLGLSQIQEVRRMLQLARASDKDVWVFSQSYSIATALLGSVANHFTITPESGSTFYGIYGEVIYFKGLFDKMGVQMDVVHIGDYKSAGEQFYRTGPSESAEKQTKQLYDSIYNQILDQISEGRSIKRSALEGLIDTGNVNSKDLLEAKLVDNVDYKTDFIKKIREKYEGAEIDRSYELPLTTGPEIDGMMDLIQLFSGESNQRDLDEPYIAVIPLEGTITDQLIADVRKQVMKVHKDVNCKAMVLRVNSPGGSALASEVFWEATDEFKQTNRPFVVSMGNVAASGGYYVAASADSIFAEKGTITGSIGVVAMKPVFGEAMDKLGLSTHVIKRGKHSDMFNTSRKFSDVERELMTNSMLEVYGTFKKRISDGRGERLIGDIESLAGGRVYSGEDALKVGLVDQIGGLNDAIEHCVQLCDLDEELFVHLFPEPKNPIEMLFAKPTYDKSDEFIKTERAGSNLANQLSINVFKQDVFSMLGEHKKYQLQTLVDQLQSINTNSIQLIAPTGLSIPTQP